MILLHTKFECTVNDNLIYYRIKKTSPIVATNLATSTILLINCPVLSPNRHKLKSIFSSLDVNFSHNDSLSSNKVFLIKSVLHFILQTDLKI